MYQFLNYFIKPFLFLLKKKKKNLRNWRELSDEKMIVSHEELQKKQNFSFRELILLALLNIFQFLLFFSNKKKKINQKKVSGNYYPIN